jgi:serine/threonine protein kinase
MNRLPAPIFDVPFSTSGAIIAVIMDIPLTPDPPSRLTATTDASSGAGQTIGSYRLLQKIGEGGMAEVWLGEQTTPVHRTVAIKLIKTGMDTKALVARFESERQALALMDHPAIARVFDAGATVEGRPFFAMEYVPGLPITEYCDQYRLSTRDRLALFVQVCEGVQHAHQKAIIHRDLKPSNVLVTVQDGKPVPKIIDFGVAKAIGQRLTEKTMFTELGVLVGTPEYMSPEQTDLTAHNIDTRTDVYSLGLILYELLVGALPFETRDLRRAGFEEIMRRIREDEPPRPSTRIRTLGEGSSTSARNRKTEPRMLAQLLAGDLDWIAIKALEKDRTRRYGSPSDLAAEIGRYLRDEPVLATPPSVTYRAKKFVRRHRSGVAVAAGVFLLLAGFAVTMAVQAQRIARERDRANREAEVSRQVTDFLTGLFRVVDPGAARGNKITAREVLDKGAAQIDTALAAQPEIQARLGHTMGVVYINLGLYPQAQALLDRAVSTQRRLFGPEHRDTLSTTNALAGLYRRQGRLADAEKILRETLTIERRVLGPEHKQTVATMTILADDLMRARKRQEAAALYRQALEVSERVLGPEHLDTLNNAAGVGWGQMVEGRHDEAATSLRNTLAIARRVLGPEDPFTFSVTGLLSEDLLAARHYDQAEAQFRELLAGRLKVLGPEHPMTLATRSVLAQTLMYEMKYGEAEDLSRETLESERRILGPESRSALFTGTNLAFIYVKQKRYQEGEKLFRELLAIGRRTYGENDSYVNNTIYNLACVAARQGRREDAFAQLRQAVDHGFRNHTAMASDEDLASIQSDPRFAAILADTRSPAAAK